MIFTLYIFDHNGVCLFYKEWNRRRHLKISKDEEFKLMYGLIASLKILVARLSPTDMKEGLQSYSTDKYRLHFYESPTSVKFLMTTDLSVQTVRDMLHQIYQVYTETVCRNVLLPSRGRPIDSQLFVSKLESLVQSATVHSK